MRKKIIVTKKLFKHLQRTLISYKLSVKTRREEGIKHKKLSKKLKKETIKQIETLTTHGFPNIFRSKHILVKIIWTILFLGALGLLIYLLYNNVNDYLEYNVTTVVRSINVDELDFPVITICNRNLASNQKGLEYFKYFFKQINKRNAKDFVSDDFDFIQDYYAYMHIFMRFQLKKDKIIVLALVLCFNTVILMSMAILINNIFIMMTLFGYLILIMVIVTK